MTMFDPEGFYAALPADCPYKEAWEKHPSLAKRVDFLTCHPFRNGGLTWCVKHRFAFDETGMMLAEDYGLKAEYTKAWAAVVYDTDSGMYSSITEDAARDFNEDEWSNYPGIEQGEWKFQFTGRSDGHIVLTDAPSWCPHSGNRRGNLLFSGRGDWVSYVLELRDLAGAEAEDPHYQYYSRPAAVILDRLYRAVVVLDVDTRLEAVVNNMNHAVAFRRQQWEEEQGAEKDAHATAWAQRLMAERLDMYGGTDAL